jgi:hypothetical protein
MTTFLFLLKYGPDGPELDDCLDVTVADGFTFSDLLKAEQVAVRMGQPLDVSAQQLARAAKMIGLRARLDGACDGPFVLRHDGDLSRDQLLKLLRDKALLKRVRAECRIQL